ncbi:MAG TPA: PPE family protein [Mycobacterium sp.]
MDFGALPPEVNSRRMYSGPGPATLHAASASWDGLAAELHAAASGYQSVVSGLTDDAWTGPSSMSMVAAVMPYLTWMRLTATRCEDAATKATAAAGAYEMAFAMTVPPPMVTANRVRLRTLIATNIFGQNTPAIMATEAEYSEMWAQDATAMYGYAANSASASALSRFKSPPQTTNPTGAANQATQSAAGSGSQTTTQLTSSVPEALKELSTPGESTAMGTAAGLGSSGASTPLSALSNLTDASSSGAVKSASVGTGSATGLLTGAASGFGSGNIYDALGLGSDVIGLGSDMAGLGADGGGLGADGGGIGMDVYGLQLDLEGAGSIVGAEGSGHLPGLGGLGDMDGLGSLGLGHPLGVDGGAAAGIGQADALGTLSVPPSWTDALGVVTPTPVADANVMPGGWGAMPGHGMSKLPLGGMVGRESDGAAQRIGFRASMIPRSPAAG